MNHKGEIVMKKWFLLSTLTLTLVGCSNAEAIREHQDQVSVGSESAVSYTELKSLPAAEVDQADNEEVNGSKELSAQHQQGRTQETSKEAADKNLSDPSTIQEQSKSLVATSGTDTNSGDFEDENSTPKGETVDTSNTSQDNQEGLIKTQETSGMFKAPLEDSTGVEKASNDTFNDDYSSVEIPEMAKSVNPSEGNPDASDQSNTADDLAHQATAEEQETYVLHRVSELTGYQGSDYRYIINAVSDKVYEIEIRDGREEFSDHHASLVGIYQYNLATDTMKTYNPLTNNF